MAHSHGRHITLLVSRMPQFLNTWTSSLSWCPPTDMVTGFAQIFFACWCQILFSAAMCPPYKLEFPSSGGLWWPCDTILANKMWEKKALIFPVKGESLLVHAFFFFYLFFLPETHIWCLDVQASWWTSYMRDGRGEWRKELRPWQLHGAPRPD